MIFVLKSGWICWPAGCSPQPRVGYGCPQPTRADQVSYGRLEQPVSGKKSKRWHHVVTTSWKACSANYQ